MLKVIGLENCGKCTITKNILEERNIEYEYDVLSNLNQEDQRKYAKMARESNYNSMPLIIRDDKLITLQEV
jgi:glutaredoxin